MTKHENIIKIEGGTLADIKKALRQWIYSYSKSIEPDFELEIYKEGRATHIIRVDERLDNEMFNFLVNYLTYPEGIEYHVTVEGFTTITDPKLFTKEKLNREVLIFIPKDDTDYDNVYAVTADNEVLKIDFGGKTTKVNVKKEFEKPSFDFSSLAIPDKLKVVSEKNNPEEITEIESSRIIKRIKIISIVISGFFLSSYLLINRTEYFLMMNYAISLGICFWFFFDYKILQNNSNYLKLVFLSLLVLLYGYYLRHAFGNGHVELIRVGTFSPISFLLIQRLYRFVFKYIMKREPIIDKPAPSFQDGVYMFLLLMSTIVFTLILINYTP